MDDKEGPETTIPLSNTWGKKIFRKKRLRCQTDVSGQAVPQKPARGRGRNKKNVRGPKSEGGAAGRRKFGGDPVLKQEGKKSIPGRGS